MTHDSLNRETKETNSDSDLLIGAVCPLQFRLIPDRLKDQACITVAREADERRENEYFRTKSDARYQIRIRSRNEFGLGLSKSDTRYDSARLSNHFATSNEIKNDIRATSDNLASKSILTPNYRKLVALTPPVSAKMGYSEYGLGEIVINFNIRRT